jgi:hypothetical protein
MLQANEHTAAGYGFRENPKSGGLIKPAGLGYAACVQLRTSYATSCTSKNPVNPDSDNTAAREFFPAYESKNPVNPDSGKKSNF